MLYTHTHTLSNFRQEHRSAAGQGQPGAQSTPCWPGPCGSHPPCNTRRGPRQSDTCRRGSLCSSAGSTSAQHSWLERGSEPQWGWPLPGRSPESGCPITPAGVDTALSVDQALAPPSRSAHPRTVPPCKPGVPTTSPPPLYLPGRSEASWGERGGRAYCHGTGPAPGCRPPPSYPQAQPLCRAARQAAILGRRKPATWQKAAGG